MRRDLLAAGVAALALAAGAGAAAAQDAGKVQVVRGSHVEMVTFGAREAASVVLRGEPPEAARDDQAPAVRVNVFVAGGFADGGSDYGLAGAGERFGERRGSGRFAGGSGQGLEFFPPQVFGPSARPARVTSQRARLR
jgi:hypothetical protein